MKTKTKISLGLGVLFALIAILVGIGTTQVHVLAGDSKAILQDNHKSLEYAREMLAAMERGGGDRDAMRVFEENLELQRANVTEGGEQAVTDSLGEAYERFLRDSLSVAAGRALRGQLYALMDLNMRAIQRKSAVAEATAGSAVVWISVAGTLCFLIGLTLWISLPGYVANPIRELTGSIQEIAAQNYSHRLGVGKDGEFAVLAESFNVMAERLEAYNRSNLAQLMMEKQRVEALVHTMQDPVMGLDEAGRVIFANAGALDVVGLTTEQVVGRLAGELAEKNDLMRMLLSGVGKEKAGAPLKIFAHGRESYFEQETLNVVVGERVAGQVIFLRNVTPHKELDVAKTNFIATVSHELKTPIAAIQMCLQLLENRAVGALNVEQQQLVDSIRDDARRLLSITGELLHMTQVESGQIQLSMLPTDVHEILGYALQTTRVAAEQKGIRFETSYPAQLPLVQADREKTAWVLTNLISNAIRYSPEGGRVWLGIAVVGGEVEISVRDEGPGIAAQYQGKVFQRYFRVPGSGQEGTGLGLAISKEFVEAQGGRIGLESAVGMGARFVVGMVVSSQWRGLCTGGCAIQRYV